MNYLDDPAHADVNVVIWSWCGQMPGKYSNGTLASQYLAPMSALETNYPDVVFVYMTGHVDIWDDADQKAACQAIRDYCSANSKVLYDFADIEHYNPDGTLFEYVADNCNYYSGPGTGLLGNRATEWQDSHVENLDWYTCTSAHSQPLNANQKAYAAWALWCRPTFPDRGDGTRSQTPTPRPETAGSTGSGRHCQWTDRFPTPVSSFYQMSCAPICGGGVGKVRVQVLSM